MAGLSQEALEQLAILIWDRAVWLPAFRPGDEYEQIRDFLLKLDLAPPVMTFSGYLREENIRQTREWLQAYLIELNRRQAQGEYLRLHIERIVLRLLSDERIRDRTAATLEVHLEPLGIAASRELSGGFTLKRLEDLGWSPKEIRSSPDDVKSTLDATDQAIFEWLSTELPSAANSYAQAVIDLAGPDRFSWRGTAADLREALREVLDHIAPDADVARQPGFRLEPDAKGPTMKQKARYVLRARGLGDRRREASENAVEAVEAILAEFVRSVYGHSSASTHTPTDREEVLRVRNFVRLALCELGGITAV